MNNCIDKISLELLDKLSAILPEFCFADSNVADWWNCVFFKSNGIMTYDKYYDTFRIANNSNITFGELISSLDTCISSVATANKGNKFLFYGKWCRNALLEYVSQKLKREISLDYEFVNGTYIYLGGESRFVSAKDESLRITMPICNESLDTKLCEGIDWRCMVETSNPDYTAGNIGVKVLELNVEEHYNGCKIVVKDSSGRAREQVV